MNFLKMCSSILLGFHAQHLLSYLLPSMTKAHPDSKMEMNEMMFTERELLSPVHALFSPLPQWSIQMEAKRNHSVPICNLPGKHTIYLGNMDACLRIPTFSHSAIGFMCILVVNDFLLPGKIFQFFKIPTVLV
jgi:hypothetical protein